ncbi:hypothetical protein BDQ12DRAFT_352275 [Crucibulum laeve]|uniref:Uncharacterized protein n=1 Tax=Crucibulum laeve TaxID=68775 RepID=A0A5C3M9X1_9AGAR|nr:hypothetical protein BDQ12DRAFT_352275 [Crucibulum laeve]
MNFLTFEGAHGLHTKVTFESRVGIVQDGISPRKAQALGKCLLVSPGTRLYGLYFHLRLITLFWWQTCWTIPFDITDVQLGELKLPRALRSLQILLFSIAGSSREKDHPLILTSVQSNQHSFAVDTCLLSSQRLSSIPRTQCTLEHMQVAGMSEEG